MFGEYMEDEEFGKFWSGDLINSGDEYALLGESVHDN